MLCCIILKYSFSPIQEMQRETPSYEALLQGLVNLGVCLYPTAPEARIKELRDDLTKIQERCASLKNGISHRQLTFYTPYTDSLIIILFYFRSHILNPHFFPSSSPLDLSCWSLSCHSWSSLIRHC